MLGALVLAGVSDAAVILKGPPAPGRYGVTGAAMSPCTRVGRLDSYQGLDTVICERLEWV